MVLEPLLHPVMPIFFIITVLKMVFYQVILTEQQVDLLFKEMNATEGYQLTVDLEAQKVIRPNGESFDFDIDEFRKDCLVQGLDEIGLTLQSADAIKDYERTREASQPWVFGAIK
jgi:3-isopropylmalate/(R)-2-methylmalate dehydratase small subunit